MLAIFYRQVIPDPQLKDHGRVKAQVALIVDGGAYDLGRLEFPSKQTWTKFYGAISKGSLGIQDLEIKMENVPYEAGLEATPQAPTADEAQVPTKSLQPTPPKVFGGATKKLEGSN